MHMSDLLRGLIVIAIAGMGGSHLGHPGFVRGALTYSWESLAAPHADRAFRGAGRWCGLRSTDGARDRALVFTPVDCWLWWSPS